MKGHCLSEFKLVVLKNLKDYVWKPDGQCFTTEIVGFFVWGPVDGFNMIIFIYLINVIVSTKHYYFTHLCTK